MPTAPQCADPPVFTTGNEVENLKTSIDLAYANAMADVGQCPGLTTQDHLRFRQLLTEWNAFRATPPPAIGAGKQWLDACDFARRLDEYRARYLTPQRCAPPRPPPSPRPTSESEHERLRAGYRSLFLWSAVGIGTLIVAGYYVNKRRAASSGARQRHALEPQRRARRPHRRDLHR